MEGQGGESVSDHYSSGCMLFVASGTATNAGVSVHTAHTTHCTDRTDSSTKLSTPYTVGGLLLLWPVAVVVSALVCAQLAFQ